MALSGDEIGDRVVLGPEFLDALQYAYILHGDQKRKGEDGPPYIGHLLQVAGIVIDEGASRDAAIAALLHDAAEDRGGTERLRDIANRFGDRVAALVKELSDSLSNEKGPWRPRKEAYIAHIKNASPEALLISIADKVHNTSAIIRDWHKIGDEVWQRFSASKEETLWYYQEVLDAFQRRADQLNMEIYMLRYLDQSVSDMQSIIEEHDSPSQ